MEIVLVLSAEVFFGTTFEEMVPKKLCTMTPVD